MNYSLPAFSSITATNQNFLFIKLSTVQFPGSTSHISGTQKAQVASCYCIGLCTYTTLSLLQKVPLDSTALDGRGMGGVTPEYLHREKVRSLTLGLGTLKKKQNSCNFKI